MHSNRKWYGASGGGRRGAGNTGLTLSMNHYHHHYGDDFASNRIASHLTFLLFFGFLFFLAQFIIMSRLNPDSMINPKHHKSKYSAMENLNTGGRDFLVKKHMKEHEEERIAREKRRQLQIEQRQAEPKNEEKDNIDQKDELENAKKENNDQGDQKAANSDRGNNDGSEKLANLEDNRGVMEPNQQADAEAEKKTEEHKSETESAKDSEKTTGIVEKSVNSENLLKESLKDVPGSDDRATKEPDVKQDGHEAANREDNQKAESTNQFPPSEQAASSEEKLPVEAAVHDQKAENENVENIELEHTNLNGADISTQDQQELPQRTEGSQETVDEGKISLEATDLVNSNADAEPTSEDHKAEDKPETQPLEGDQINVEVQVPVNSEDSQEVNINTNENIDGKTVDESVVNTEATKDIPPENSFPGNANAIEQPNMPQANQEKEDQNSDHSAEEGTNEHAANQETMKKAQHIKHSSEEM